MLSNSPLATSDTKQHRWRRGLCIRALEVGVSRVNGRNAVRKHLTNTSNTDRTAILAIGKAASSMCLGALDVLGRDAPALIVTKYDHVDEELESAPNVKVIQSGHPIPDEMSLLAGKEVIRFVEGLDDQAVLVVLVSGGASALVEALPDGMGLNDLQNLTEGLISGGKTIGEINQKRIEISEIKGGKLLENFKGQKIFAYFISDVPADDISVIGSGIGSLPQREYTSKVSKGDASRCSEFSSYVIGTNEIAREAISDWCDEAGLKVVRNEGTLDGDVFTLSEKLSREIITGEDGVYIWGGEPTIELPAHPGRGGRNQSLALAIAKDLRGHDDIAIIVAGTDGTDGPTDAAGGIVDSNTFGQYNEAERALLNADAGTYLQGVGDIYVSGPTGTNVMDIVVGIKLPDKARETIASKHLV